MRPSIMKTHEGYPARKLENILTLAPMIQMTVSCAVVRLMSPLPSWKLHQLLCHVGGQVSLAAEERPLVPPHDDDVVAFA